MVTPDSFRRITSSGRYIPEVDGLRFIASASVVALHCYGEMLDRQGLGISAMEHGRGLLRLLGHGGYGVEIFFAISGFLLALPFARQHLQGARPVKLRTFFLRRLTRIVPPYVLWLLIRAALLLALTALPIHYVMLHLVASLFYVHSIAYGIASRIEAVSWTLEIEVQFYLLCPLLCSVYRISRRILRRTLLMGLIAVATPLQWAFLPGWHGPQNSGVFNLSLLAGIQFFGVGMLVADLYIDGWARIARSWRWDAASFVLWPLLFWLQPHAFRFLGPLLLPILFVGAFKGPVVSSVLRHPAVTAIGGMCYSIYLTHRTTIWICVAVLARSHLQFGAFLAASLCVGSCASVAVGALYFRWIERPCMDPAWPQRLFARQQRRAPRSESGRVAISRKAS